MNNLLELSMAVAVPMAIQDLESRGGPTSQDLAEAAAMGDVLGEKGDRLLFKSKNKGETATLFSRTARAVAVLAYCPGGVRIFGQHFKAGKHNQ